VVTGTDPTAPVLLAANTVPSFYRGAGRIGVLRRDPSLPVTDPEDWIASTARRTGMGDRGLTTLPDGTLLHDRIAQDPAAWLGPGLERSRLLIKLLDAGSRLPLHIHPDRTFAGKNLGSPDGKTEAWIVLHAEPDAFVHLGFSHDISADELQDLVIRQDLGALLARTNRVPVRAGDVLLCPAGVPHAIGAGVLVIELQEATDFSIMLEWDGYPLDPADAFLGLEPATAQAATDRAGYGTGRLLELLGQRVQPLATAPAGTQPLLPPAAAGFFGADQVRPASEGTTLDAGFSVLIVLEGDGFLSGTGPHPAPVRAGQTWLIPFAAGPTLLTGDVTAIRCYPA
jgi:mannose-6-phosphate isomerase